ncbi:hypothetical protein KK137_10515 [Croceibacterium sp. LX-88]|uniref:Heme exporter protein D n=1 Tax=Croceibacterium selenioxidans TaxID=2838833 RepID=A0ABS5W4T7_9SPHN|nr:hypothetical protein [Croceibacterium selenioxidans]MBT2134768.1 hypothetical protein [Croceibacterium selenioxidans]
MSDLPARLLFACSLIGVLLLTAVAGILWARHNTHARRIARERAKQERRDDVNLKKASASRSDSGR